MQIEKCDESIDVACGGHNSYESFVRLFVESVVYSVAAAVLGFHDQPEAAERTRAPDESVFPQSHATHILRPRKVHAVPSAPDVLELLHMLEESFLLGREQI